VEYARLLVDEGWPVLGRHESSPRADAALDGLWQSYLRLGSSLGATSRSYATSIERALEQIED